MWLKSTRIQNRTKARVSYCSSKIGGLPWETAWIRSQETVRETHLKESKIQHDFSMILINSVKTIRKQSNFIVFLRLPWMENGKCLVTRTIRFSWWRVHKMEPSVFMFFLEEITSFAKFHTETSGYVWWSEASSCHLGTPWCSATPEIVGSDRRTGAMQASAMVIPCWNFLGSRHRDKYRWMMTEWTCMKKI